MPTSDPRPEELDHERRDFMKRCGRFAVVTPPAMTMMLAVTTTPAQAKGSHFKGVGWGVGGNPQTKTPGQHPKS